MIKGVTIAGIVLILVWLIDNVGLATPYLDIVTTYPANLMCHARGGEFYYNNPSWTMCVNVSWNSHFPKEKSSKPCDGSNFCTNQKFWKVYRNPFL